MATPIFTAAAALALAATATGSAHAADQCIAPREAESLFLALAPTLIGTVSASCAASLPSNALLRRSVGPLTAKYAAESDAAWPLARQALKKIVGPDASEMLESELARPMLTAMVAPMLAKEVKPSDCPNIDRVLTLIDPLPARNTAALLVAIIEMSDRGKPSRTNRSKFPICPPAPPRQ